MMPSVMLLEIVRGNDAGAGLRWTVTQPCVIGREAGCDLRLSDREASRRHARLCYRDGQVMVEDLNSRNGTHLNGNPIATAAVFEKDELGIGRTVIRLSQLDAAGGGAPDGAPGDGQSPRVLASARPEEADLIACPPVAADDLPAGVESRLLRHLCELSSALASARYDDAQLMPGILDRVKTILDTDTACIVFRDSKQEWTATVCSGNAARAAPPRLSRTIIAQAVRQGMAVLTDNPLMDERFSASESIVRRNISSAVCVPMKIDGAFRGVLYADRSERADALTPLDLRVAATVANLLAMFIDKKRLHDDMLRKTRLAAVGHVMAGLAHYAKNIIAGLRLSVSTMERMVQRRNIEGIETCAAAIVLDERRLTDLILDMLNFARDREPVRLKMDLGNCITGALAPFRPIWTAQGIDLELSIDPDAREIWAETNALARIFVNLIQNSIEALSQKDGERRIRVRVEREKESADIAIRWRDTGCGMPRAVRDQVFDVLFSTKGPLGTGLGLAVAKKVVDEHGGTITVDAEEGRWTEFRIFLPRAAEPADDAGGASRA